MTLALFLMLATSLAPQAERFDAFEKTSHGCCTS